MRKILLGAAVIGCVLLGGCTTVYNLTAEESDLIAEYTAVVLSKNSYVNKRDYLTLKTYLYAPKEPVVTNPGSNTDEQPTQNPDANVEIIDPKAEENTNSNPGSSAAVSNIADVLGMNNVKITCLGYDVLDMYPKDEFALSVSANKGKKLVVVYYNLMNLTSESVLIHINSDVTVRAVINGGSSVTTFPTLLNDDIMNMDGKELTPGETKTGVFIFEVKEDLCSSIASLNVEVKKK